MYQLPLLKVVLRASRHSNNIFVVYFVFDISSKEIPKFKFIITILCSTGQDSPGFQELAHAIMEATSHELLDVCKLEAQTIQRCSAVWVQRPESQGSQCGVRDDGSHSSSEENAFSFPPPFYSSQTLHRLDWCLPSLIIFT